MTTDERNKLLDKLKVQLILRGSIFLSTIAFNLKFTWDESIPTAATNGNHLLFNPHFFDSLSKEERLFVYVHECWHVAFLHIIRGRNKDKTKYNKAADHCINLMLIKAGFIMPKDGLADLNYTGLSTDEIYDLLPDPDKEDDYDCDIQEAEDGSPEEAKAKQLAVENLVAKAVEAERMSGKDIGNIPNEIMATLDKLLNPKLPWNVILMNHMTSHAKQDYSWRKPNRRYLNIGYLPSLYSENLESVVVWIDVSWSVTKEEFHSFLAEIQEIHSTYKPVSMTIGLFNTHIIDVFEITETDDILSIPFKTGGGTNLTATFKWLYKATPAVSIIFSDLEVNIPHKAPDTDLIWICINNPKKTVPFGKLIHYESEP